MRKFCTALLYEQVANSAPTQRRQEALSSGAARACDTARYSNSNMRTRSARSVQNFCTRKAEPIPAKTKTTCTGRGWGSIGIVKTTARVSSSHNILRVPRREVPLAKSGEQLSCAKKAMGYPLKPCGSNGIAECGT